jgi:hypothetical protein
VTDRLHDLGIKAKHFFYASGWKKFEPAWDLLIRTRQLARVTPLLEGVLSRITSARAKQQAKADPDAMVETRSNRPAGLVHLS